MTYEAFLDLLDQGAERYMVGTRELIESKGKDAVFDMFVQVLRADPDNLGLHPKMAVAGMIVGIWGTNDPDFITAKNAPRMIAAIESTRSELEDGELYRSLAMVHNQINKRFGLEPTAWHRMMEGEKDQPSDIVIRRAVEHLLVGLPIMNPNQVAFTQTGGLAAHSMLGYIPGENKLGYGWGSDCLPVEMAAQEQVAGGTYTEGDADLPELNENELGRWDLVFDRIHEFIHEGKGQIVRFGCCDQGFTAAAEREDKLGSTQAAVMLTLLEALEGALWPLE